MKFKMRKLTALLVLLMLSQAFAAGGSMAASSATKYRVYQNDAALKEFVTEKQAIAYAQSFTYSHVEQISGRVWVWDNFPRYKVYQGGASNPKWEYRTYEQAQAAAKQLGQVHIRDLQQPGWVYESYAKFQLYQGENTKSSWGFATLAAAKKEAANWGNAHIIKRSTNEWVWDNVTAAQKKQQRAGKAVYTITKDGGQISGTKTYAYLYDAVQAAAKQAGSEVTNTAKGKVVFSNVRSYEVQQNGKTVKAFISIEAAIPFAKKYAGADVVYNNVVWWTNKPYLSVYQSDKIIKSVHTRESAVTLAKSYANATVRNADGRALWSNVTKLIYMGWNGSSNSQTILGHVAGTQGLDIDSPTWFELGDASGKLNDMSDAATASTLKAQGVLVMPLLHNQFDRKMTSAFLADPAAQAAFINSLVAKLESLRVYGLNIDFEEVAGADRASYTAFVKALTKAVHAKGMKVSIDLPRGSASWNQSTAYDHTALAGIVDTIIIMAYDEHWSTGPEAGSVSSLAWAEEGVKQFLDYGIPRKKLMLGIPFYVREWKLDSAGALISNRAIYMKEVPQLIKDTNAVGTPDVASGQTKYTYVKDGFTYVFWAETASTVQARINMAKKYDLAGVAAWRLGYESADLWTMMLRLK
ncbi:Spore germination protein YaaH [Paenibacillus algorifonticola]|uniref:Spore germination protein YaaH n=1 Tax=Paenibacillus algorifonticola TaxID=684063 RepID=A0A1I2BXE6_9BACL|nr:glycosyl hydrolase family 18 protein [Paenibacillus algorifonticola]SFE60781.1 Spore germination protein YaaH [Paenibacillus algorifonticola]